MTYTEMIWQAYELKDAAAMLKLLALNPEDKGSIKRFLQWYLNEHGAPCDGWRSDYHHWDLDRHIV